MAPKPAFPSHPLHTDNAEIVTSRELLLPLIAYVAVALLNLGNRRLRRRNTKAFNKLVRSISHFGIVRPVLVDSDYGVIDGHAVVEAAIELGLTKIPVLEISHLDKASLAALSIALNKTQEQGQWNDDVVRQTLELIIETDVDFDLEVTGMDMGEIEFSLAGQPSAGETHGPDPADNIPMLEGGAAYDAVSRLGDLFLLKANWKQHHLYCGDARSSEDVITALAGLVATMVITDPPYNVPIQGHVSGLGRTRHREFAMASGEMSDAEFAQFLHDSLLRLKQATIDGALIYCFMDKGGLETLLRVGRELGLSLIDICIWRKTNAGMGSFYRKILEFVAVFKNGTAPHINNVELGRYGRYRTTDWHYPGFNTFSKDRMELLKLHPTVKPVQLLVDAIRDASKRGDVILDTFAGSGSTLIAAEKARRQAVCIEFDPIYVDTIIKRFEDQFGAEAVHAETGLTFSELTALRASEAEATRPSSDHRAKGSANGRLRVRKSSKRTDAN